jgi:ribosomal-protein-alanine N-acetyltransferase
MPDCPSPPALAVHVRHPSRIDHAAIAAIDAASFPDPWTRRDLARVLIGPGGGNGICLVAHLPCGRIVGYAVLAYGKDRIDVLRLAVAPDVRRYGIGRQIVGKIVGKLHDRRATAVVVVRETSGDEVLRFLATQGFRATGVEREAFDGGEDGYRFAYHLAGGVDPAVACEEDGPWAAQKGGRP